MVGSTSDPNTSSQPFFRWYDRLVQLLGHAAGFVLGVMAVLICLDIGVRYFGLGALPWVIELSEYLMYGGAFLGAPWVLRENGHVALDIVTSKLPARSSRRIEVIACLFGLLACAAMAVYGGSAVYGAWHDHMVTVKTWRYHEWVLLLPIPMSGVLMAIEFVRRILFPVPRDPAQALQSAIP